MSTLLTCAGASFIFAQQQRPANSWNEKKEFDFYKAASFFPELNQAPVAGKTAQSNKRVIEYLHSDSIQLFDKMTVKYVGGRGSEIDLFDYSLSVDGPNAGTRFDTLYRESVSGQKLRYINQFDGMGNISEWRCQTLNGSGSYVDMAKETYTWNGNQLQLREYSSSIAGSWMLQSRTQFTYNTNGLKVADTSYWYASNVNRWNMNQRSEYQYNSSNKLVSAKLYTPKTSGSALLSVSHIVENTFNGAGLLHTAMYFLFDTATNAMKAMYKDSFGYIGSANIQYIEAMYMDSSKWKKNGYEYRHINAYGLADSIDRFAWDKTITNWRQKTRVRYSYDGDHDLVRSISLVATAGGNAILPDTVYEEQYFYETFSRSTGVKTPEAWNGQVQVYPNPASDVLLINNLTQDGLSVMITDIKGSIVYNGQVQAGKSKVSLQQLTEGMYFVKVYDTGGRTETFKIMKL